MTATTTWKVTDLKREISDGYVFTAAYEAISSESGVSESAKGSVALERPEPGDFIPYDNLTEALCVSWVKEALGEELVGRIEGTLQRRVHDKISPQKADGLPWVEYPETGPEPDYAS